MRTFITHTTENYEHITLNLVRSIKKYSSYNIIVYTIDYEGSELLQKQTSCKRLDLNLPKLDDSGFILSDNGNKYVNRQHIRSYFTLGAKVDVMLDASLNLDEWVYIDSDSVVNKNIDSIFEHCSKITEFPLATLGPHEYVLIVKPNGSVVGNPFWREDGSTDYENTLEWPLMKFFGLESNQRSYYRTTNILVGNKKTQSFLSLWKQVKDILPKLVNLEEIVPYHEETIYNVLYWKINPHHDSLPLSYINVTGASTLEHFFNINLSQDTLFDVFYRVPKNKKEIKVFHGEKRQSEIDKMFEIIDLNHQDKINLLFLAPHLSTGGMPGFLLKMIEVLKEYHPEFEIFVIEYSNYGDAFSAQKNKIKQIISKNNFWTLGENKFELMDIIDSIKPEIIHVQEMVEGFDTFNQMPDELIGKLYNNNRTWRMVETCHNVWFNPENKMFNPEAFAFCTPYHKEKTFKNVPSYGEVIQFPIDDKKITPEEKLEAKKKLGFDLNKTHVINVGLWTQGKNQKEGVEIARLLQGEGIEFHFIGNQAQNFESYWGPLMLNRPSNVHIWGERNDVETFMKAADVFMFNSTWECNPLVLREAISYGLKILSRNLPQYLDMFSEYITEIDDNLELTITKLLNLIKKDIQHKVPNGQDKVFSDSYAELYKKVLNIPINKEKYETTLSITQYFINQPFLEIKGKSPYKYKVQFRDENDKLHYENILSSNSWVKLNREYFTKWRTKIWEEDELIYENILDYTDKRVFIAFKSSSLGDSIAWMPYVKEFQEKHSCKVIVSTFWNKLFQKVYPEIEFVEPGVGVNNIHGMYNIGWFYDESKEPVLPSTIPLQKTATNILGLDYKEIKPKVYHEIKERPFKEKYITIATNSTAGCKFWTKDGWQGLINYFHKKGYKVINVSKEKNPFNNQISLSDTSIDNTMNVIYHSEFFVGLSSGLSWLAWALGKKVVMISNFTEADHEFTLDCIRITNPNVCNSCWNNPNYKFDKGDWNWCPVHKGTKRQFECHTSITSEMVIEKIKNLLD